MFLPSVQATIIMTKNPAPMLVPGTLIGVKRGAQPFLRSLATPRN